MFIQFQDLAKMGIIGTFVIGFFVVFGAFTWPILLAWLFLTWLSMKFCK